MLSFASILLLSTAVLFAGIAFAQTASSDTEKIPSPLKTVARQWSSGQISDSDFIQSFQYLINYTSINQATQNGSGTILQPIPLWLKTDARWWSDGNIGDSDFIKGIQYLFAMGYKWRPVHSVINVSFTVGAGTSIQCLKNNTCLSPSEISIKTGDKVVWTNNDFVAHTVASGKPSDDKTGTIFESGLIPAGGNYSFIFNRNGTYNYFCKIHPWISGIVSVSGDNQPKAIANGSDQTMASAGSANTPMQPTGTLGMPVLSDSDKEAVIKAALNDPGIKAWSNAWKVTAVDRSGTTNQPTWKYAYVMLYLSPDDPAHAKCDVGWTAKVKVDVDTKQDVLAWYPTSLYDCNDNHGIVNK